MLRPLGTVWYFCGNGVLALFGLDTDPATACRKALRAASAVASNVAYLNHQFASEVREPIQYGIGIHAGEVIVGDIGFRGHTVFTALGDAVNVASRLQDLTKELDCKVVVSEEVCKTAGLSSDVLTQTDVAIRGHDGQMMTVRIATDPTVCLQACWIPHPHLMSRSAKPWRQSDRVYTDVRFTPGSGHLRARPCRAFVVD